MAGLSSSPLRPSFQELRAISYEDALPGKPPIPITVATSPQNVNDQKGIAGYRRNLVTRHFSPNTSRSKLHDDIRRDSGLAPSSSTARDSRTTLDTEIESLGTPSVRQSPRSIPAIAVQNNGLISPSSKPISSNGTPLKRRSQQVDTQEPKGDTNPGGQPFLGQLPEIPTGSLEDLTLPGKVEFSKRGSMLIGGMKANNPGSPSSTSHEHAVGSRRQPVKRESLLTPASGVPSRILSADDEALSLNVRSMYDADRSQAKQVARLQELAHDDLQDDNIESVNTMEKSLVLNGEVHPAIRDTPDSPLLQPPPERSNPRVSIVPRGPSQSIGPIEDYEDLDGDVDRYGFIIPKSLTSQASSLNSARAAPHTPGIRRVSTLLQLASESPRQSRSRLGNVYTSRSAARSTDATSTNKSAASLFRPQSSQSSYRSGATKSRLKHATNRLPYNKDRRCVDEAGDMLTLPPGLADIAEDQEDGQIAIDLKRREWERGEKWRKMAKIVKRDNHGGGMLFQFDTKSPKVIDRTWKGIPDRWRSAAWHSFLTASARLRKGMTSDEDLIAIFKTLVDQNSPDDVQIDIDVPRTISGHIMFRRRYQGGQRLLFRVLHCMSIYFPDIGYVQGMAALAATLLCYYDEEMTFVMMVRLWQLRGLDRLYASGFEGLMQALEEFEGQWLGKGEVAAKLSELNIPPTSYGTRWYLTLFNYSIPFPAQLRVWDVFMLLGDPDPYRVNPKSKASFNGGLDVLHACSAALVDGTREILLDSDFENAMKVLTSWIPVKDEELLMQVARVEWKMKRRRGPNGRY